MLIRLGLRPRRITSSSISIIFHKILSLVNYLFIYLCIFVHLPDVFEWLAISLSSFGLVLATIILLLKRRRLRHNDTRPLQVRTVICYHNGQDDVHACVTGQQLKSTPCARMTHAQASWCETKDKPNLSVLNFSNHLGNDRCFYDNSISNEYPTCV